MKPLQMLDYVMLWIARAYALFGLGYRSFLWLKFAAEPAPIFPSAPHTIITYHGPTTWLGFLIILSLLLTVGLFTIQQRLGQFLVMLCAAATIVIAVYGVIHLAVLLSSASSVNPHFYGKFKLIALGTACTVAIHSVNIYLALRWMRRSKQDGGNPLPPHLTFQSV